MRYTATDWDFNGVFSGSGTGNSGLASAVTYLTPGTAANSPIASLLAAGLTAFPGTTQFGIRNTATGQIIPASNVAALNALNGNGLLQQTVLNQQLLKQRDWGSDFGVKYDVDGGDWTNSLTVGAMLYSTHQDNDQSGVAPVLNDVVNQSNIYDVVALNNAGNVLGSLTNNGLVSYGDWGAGISYYNLNSYSGYFNNEFTWEKKLHVDFGLRFEHEEESAAAGNSTSAPIAPGIQGVNQTNPNAFNGTFNYSSGHETPTNYTIGVNYTVSPNLSVYARYERGYETQGDNPSRHRLDSLRGRRDLRRLRSHRHAARLPHPVRQSKLRGWRGPQQPQPGPGIFRQLHHQRRRPGCDLPAPVRFRAADAPSRCTSRRPTRARRSTMSRWAISTSTARTSRRRPTPSTMGRPRTIRRI